MTTKLSPDAVLEDLEMFTVGPLPNPDDLVAFLSRHRKIELSDEYLGFMCRAHAIHGQQVVHGRALRRRATLPAIESIMPPNRGCSPILFGLMLKQALEEDEGPLEGGGSNNIFWLPKLTVTARFKDDGKLHVEPFEGVQLEIYDKVFIGGLSV